MLHAWAKFHSREFAVYDQRPCHLSDNGKTVMMICCRHRNCAFKHSNVLNTDKQRGWIKCPHYRGIYTIILLHEKFLQFD